jgi:hypothetical protein
MPNLLSVPRSFRPFVWEKENKNILCSFNLLFYNNALKRSYCMNHRFLIHLNSDNEAPWADWKKGDSKGLTAEKLSRILKPFKIKSDQTQIDNRHVRGYWLKDFEETFASYLPPEDPGENQGDNT